VAAHGGITKRDVQGGVGDADPVTAASAGDDDRIAAVFGEGFQDVGRVHHDRAPLV